MILIAALAACSGDECLTDLDAACTPLYEPTFQNVFDQTLKPTCGIGGSTCHSVDGRKAGLVFAEIDEAHRLLLDGRVEPNDAACSLVMRRISSDESDFQMPPGRKLVPTEQCAIQQWIANGAMR